MGGLSMPIKGIAIFLIIASVIVFAGCEVNDGMMTDKTTREIYSRPSDFSKSLSLDMTPEMKEILLSLDIKMTSGTLRLVAMNPDGDASWNSIFTNRDRIKERLEFEPVEGTWTLFYDGDDVVGEIEMKWIGKF
jgi:hypothetical protein